MSFKHIDFNDSPVMRNLVKVALDKGMVEPSKEEVEDSSIEKKASFEPTDNLHLDIIRLAEGLRTKGFEKEAEQLENKLAVLKRAKKDLKKEKKDLNKEKKDSGVALMEAAHPEGDVQIGSSPYGIVETMPTAQKRIHDIVNKQPTGKYAQSVEDIVKAAENAIGLKKESGCGKSDMTIDDAIAWVTNGSGKRYMHSILTAVMNHAESNNSAADIWGVETHLQA